MAPGSLCFVASLGDYLDLTPDSAREQWKAIARREPKPRQAPFLPVETILCFGLFRLCNPRAFGGANIHRAPAAVHALARSFVRTPGSITSKMLNLDGSRAHGGKVEPAVFARLMTDLTRYRVLYLICIRAARSAGFGESDVPDFLGADAAELDLLGQDELGRPEVEQALAETERDRSTLSRKTGLSEPETEAIVEQRVRLGQHRFASQVLANAGHSCSFCGFSPRSLPRQRLLVASHIKPWSRSTPTERLDPLNGIAACPIHDAAFDTGLITVNGGLRIHSTDALRASVVSDPGVEWAFGNEGLRAALVLPSGAKRPRAKYLEFHHAEVYKGYLAAG